MECGRGAEAALHLPDLCMVAAGRASTNDSQMIQGDWGARSVIDV